jgi:hypothetical protein
MDMLSLQIGLLIALTVMATWTFRQVVAWLPNT